MLHSGPGTKDNCAAAVVECSLSIEQCSRHSYCYICSSVLAALMGPFKVLLYFAVGKERRIRTKGLLERTTYNWLKVDHEVNGRDGEGEEMEEAPCSMCWISQGGLMVMIMMIKCSYSRLIKTSRSIVNIC